MEELEYYIEHCSGLYSFFAWLEDQNNKGMNFFLEKQIIYANKLTSRYFSICVLKGKQKELCLATQSIESEWLSLIKWSHVAIQKNNNYIYLISKSVKGDQVEYPDLPYFVLALYVDTLEKINLIANQKNITAREYFKEDNKHVFLNLHKQIFKLPIVLINSETELIVDENILDYSQIINMKEKNILTISENITFLE